MQIKKQKDINFLFIQLIHVLKVFSILCWMCERQLSGFWWEYELLQPFGKPTVSVEVWNMHAI